jgi:hypothetical protein
MTYKFSHRDAAAKALFESQTFKHPQGLVPTWDTQPESIKADWRKKADRASRFTWNDGDVEHH